MQKVAGVSAVRVSLNEGLTVLDLKPGNTVTLLRLREVIRNNGFVTREAKVIASGTAAPAGNDMTFEVAGTRERFLVIASTNEERQRTDELRVKAKAAPSVPLLLTGAVDIADPKSMKVKITAI